MKGGGASALYEETLIRKLPNRGGVRKPESAL